MNKKAIIGAVVIALLAGGIILGRNMISKKDNAVIITEKEDNENNETNIVPQNVEKQEEKDEVKENVNEEEEKENEKKQPKESIDDYIGLWQDISEKDGEVWGYISIDKINNGEKIRFSITAMRTGELENVEAHKSDYDENVYEFIRKYDETSDRIEGKVILKNNIVEVIFEEGFWNLDLIYKNKVG